jgi:hypothetical protein
MDHRPNCKTENFWKKSKEKNLGKLGFGDKFLNVTSKPQSMEEKKN